MGAGAESIRSIKSNDIVTNMIVAGSSAAMAEVLVEQWTNVRGTYERLHQENPNMDQPEFIRKVQAETAGARTAAHLVTATLAGIGSELANQGIGGIGRACGQPGGSNSA